MSQVHLSAFIDDAKTNYNQRFTESRSSLKPLTVWLKTQVANPQPTTYATLLAMVSGDNRHTKYKDAIRRLATVWSTPAAYPSKLLEERFCTAYHRALYWHGVSRDVVPSILATGLLTQYGCCKFGDTNPGRAALPGGGPISLGIERAISEPYGSGNNLLRVFPTAERGRHALLKKYTVFVKGERQLVRDFDNPGAVLLLDDLEPEYILQGAHTAVVIAQPTTARSQAILLAIGSYDADLPQNARDLMPYLKIAIETGKVGDTGTSEPIVPKTTGANKGYWESVA